jgi:hypothetical protein
VRVAHCCQQEKGMATRRSRKRGLPFEDVSTSSADCLVWTRPSDRREDMRTVATTLLLLGLLGSLVTGCGSAAADPQSACDQAFAQAMAIQPGSDTVSSVDGAIAGCQSLEAWVAAAERYPDAFGAPDPAALARQRCAANPELANAPVCADLQGG